MGDRRISGAPTGGEDECRQCGLAMIRRGTLCEAHENERKAKLLDDAVEFLGLLLEHYGHDPYLEGEIKGFLAKVSR